MGDLLIMSGRERERKAILSRYERKEISLLHASKLMRVSYRQGKRLWQRYRTEGDAGLVHRARGGSKKSRYDEGFKLKCLSAYEQHYAGFGPTFASEKLEEREQLKVPPETLRLWLKSAGLWRQKRKRSPHRHCRERRACFGELLQIDGSIHRWFGPQQDYHCLLRAIDDATGIRLAVLAEEESLSALLQLLWQWIRRYGIPEAVYVDLKTLYVSRKHLRKVDEAHKEASAAHQFERICEALGIRIIHAYSPQAKGRVERAHQVDQDRLVKEIQLHGFDQIDQVNTFMKRYYTPQLNRKFRVTPFDPRDAHRPKPRFAELTQILCWQYQRQCRQDWTFQFQNQWYQLDKTMQSFIRPKQKVTVHVQIDGSMSVSHKGRGLQYQSIPKPERIKPKRRQRDVQAISRRSTKNKAKTPWSQFNPAWLTRQKTKTNRGHF